MIEPAASRQPGQRHLVVCVDDFGLNDGVNQAVLDLVALGRVSAVSCLVDGPAWPSGAQALQLAVQGPDQALADVGLHLNFTELLDRAAQAGAPRCELGTLIWRCYGRRWHQADLVREIDRQWGRFEAVWGRAPDFVDGHQHVHQLPQIRDALAQVLQRRLSAGLSQRLWLRQCRSPGWLGWRAGISLSDTAKAAVIAALGASCIGQVARRLGLRHSQRLLGVYPFDADEAGYLRRWQTWLALAASQGDVLMCHPAAPSVKVRGAPDVIAASREMEYEVLCSAALGQLLRDGGVHIGRFGS